MLAKPKKWLYKLNSRTDDREAEGARLEIVCTPKGYRGFESHSVRHLQKDTPKKVFF